MSTANKHYKAYQVFSKTPGLNGSLKSEQLNKSILDKSVYYKEKFKLKTLEPPKSINAVLNKTLFFLRKRA